MKEKKWGKNEKKGLLWGALVSLVLLGILSGWLYEKILGNIDRIDEDHIDYLDPEEQDQFEEPDLPEEGGDAGPILPEDGVIWPEVPMLEAEDVTKVLLVGTDVWKEGSRGRADAIILATFSERTGALSLISFQRDTYVRIPGYRDNRINTAYAFGGTKLLKEVLELNFGVTVDGVVVIDFTRFQQLIDALGGVEIELTQREAEHLRKQGAQVTEGMNHLNGEWALAYSRIRKIDSDFRRTDRQRKVLIALFQAYRDLPLSQVPGMLEVVLPMVSTDLRDGQILRYATKVMLSGQETVHSRSIPFAGVYENATIRGMQVLMADLEACNRALAYFLHGQETPGTDA